MQTAFYDDLKQRFLVLLTEHGLLQEKVSLHTKMLTPEEAIGIPKRKDFPILSGKDIMVRLNAPAVWARHLLMHRLFFTEP